MIIFGDKICTDIPERSRKRVQLVTSGTLTLYDGEWLKATSQMALVIEKVSDLG